MTWTTATLVLGLGLVFLLQALSCLPRHGRPPYVRWFGGLSLLLAIVLFLLYALLATGAMIPSVEFGMLIVQGWQVEVLMMVLILGVAVAAALGWHVALMARARNASALWPILLGLAAGVVAIVYQLELLTPQVSGHLRVSAFELSSPLFVIWVTFCFVQAALAVVDIHHARGRLWATLTVVAAFSFWALGHPAARGVISESMWELILKICFPGSLALAAWISLRAAGTHQRLADSMLVVILINALVDTASWLAEGRPHDTYVTAMTLVVWPATLGLLLSIASRIPGTGVSRPWTHLPPPRGQKIAVVIGLAVVGWSLADLLYFSILQPWANFMVLLVAWVAMAELSAAPLVEIWTSLKNGSLFAHPAPATPAAPSPGTTAPAASGPTTTTTTATSPAPTTTAPTGGGLLARVPTIRPVMLGVLGTLLFVLVVVILGELPNIGKTVIVSFSEPSDAPRPNVSERLLTALGLLDQDLRPDAIRLLPRSETGGATFRLATGGGAPSPVDATLAKNNDLALGEFKIPLSFFSDIVRDPARFYLLRVRVVSGNHHSASDRHVLLARSTAGETWKVEAANVTDLTDELAFQIITAPDSNLRVPGLTRSWPAFRNYRRGLEAWRRFETDQKPETLEATISGFVAAIRNHAGFGLAYYRLGVAMARSGQPSAAADAFRTSVKTSPDLVAGYLGLASILYDYETSLQGSRVGAIPTIESSVGLDRQARITEARDLWRRVLSLPSGVATSTESASAFYGLCRDALDTAKGQASADARLRFLAFYYCKRAERLYTGLSTTERRSPAMNEATAAVLNTLGDLLNGDGYMAGTITPAAWQCDVDPLRRSAYARRAREYYERAEDLLPYNGVVRCHAAKAAYALTDTQKMTALENDPAARVTRAEQHLQRARSHDAHEYSEALREYDAALKLDPGRIDALAGYAAAYWEWRLRQAGDVLEPRPMPPIGSDARGTDWAEQAERHATRLVRITERLRPPTDKDSGVSTEEVVARRRLGEVLLAQELTDRAIVEFENALRRAGGGDADNAPALREVDELRWDLAQAYLCAVANAEARGTVIARAAEHRQKAVSLMRKVRANEERREIRPYTSQQDRLLNPAQVLNVCRHATPAETQGRFVLQDGDPVYSAHLLCAQSVLRIALRGSGLASTAQYFVHVWGGGINRRGSVQPLFPLWLVLGSVPDQSSYHVQLQDYTAAPVSLVHTVRAIALDDPGRCSRNLLTLTFDERFAYGRQR